MAQPPVIEYHDFSTGRVSVVAEPGPDIAGWVMSVSPDGRWVLYDVEEAESDIMLVENYR